MITGNRYDRYAGPSSPIGAANGPVRLGDAVQQVLRTQVSPRQAKLGSVVESWERLVPAEIAGHCGIRDLRAGVLKVMADSPSYVYELQLCRSRLLTELQRDCPGAGIRKIELSVGSV